MSYVEFLDNIIDAYTYIKLSTLDFLTISHFKVNLKDFAWEDQREKLCYIGHIAPQMHLECYITNIP